jgi:hypothetical protein
MSARALLLRLLLRLRGSIPTWMLTAEEVPLRAKGLMLGAVAGVSGPLGAIRRGGGKDGTGGNHGEL